MAHMSEAARENEKWAKEQESLTDDEVREILKPTLEDGFPEAERRAAQDRVFRAFVRYVFIILRSKYYIRESDWDDFEQESKFALFRAVRHYDCRESCGFQTYMTSSVNHAVRDACRRNRTIPIPDKTSRKIEKVKKVMSDFECSTGRVPTDEEIAGILEYDVDTVRECKMFAEQSCLLIGTGTAPDGDGAGDDAEWLTALSREDGTDGSFAAAEDSVDAGKFFENVTWLGKGILDKKDLAMIKLVISSPVMLSQGNIADVFAVTRESITARARKARLAVASAMYMTWGPGRIPEDFTIDEIQDFILEKMREKEAAGAATD